MNDTQPWWLTDTYDVGGMFPSRFHDLAGPKGPALVKVYDDGRTQPGWGLVGPEKGGVRGPGFLENYAKGKFDSRKAGYQFRTNGHPFAFVMRSLRVVALDIDGKNDGFRGAKGLGNLPYTLAETSKSGNGYHLFFTTEEEWDVDSGFSRHSDAIGVAQGVDFRGVGCVYHHSTQRWNDREISPLPEYLADLLDSRYNRRTAGMSAVRKTLEMGDPMETMLMHADLMADLNRPIPDGRRNNTLYGIGMKLRTAGVSDWRDLLMTRGTQVGLDLGEVAKLVANIERQPMPQ